MSETKDTASMPEPDAQDPTSPEMGANIEGQGTSRGEFLKWGTVALSGMYVGPKITSFAVEKSLGHAGSVPTHPPAPVPPSSPPEYFPPTGGAAKVTPQQRKELLEKRENQ